MNLRHASVLLLPLLAGACSSFLPPRAEPPAVLEAAPNMATGAAPTVYGAWPAAGWWRQYGDSTLDALMTQALAQAPSLVTAEARFNVASETARIAAASAGVRVDAEASLARRRLSDNGMMSPEFLGYNWYNQADLGLNATYSFDFWRKQAALTAAAVSESRAAQAEHGAAALLLTATVAERYFAWQSDQIQRQILDEQEQLIKRRQDIVQARINADLEPADALYALEAELAALRGARIEVQASADLQRMVIAALLGISSEQLPAFTARKLPVINTALPEDAHIGLLARRADITASRWRVDAAQRQLDAARASFMPDLSINALAALSSIDLGKLLQAGSAAPSVGATLRLPLFDSGLLQAQYGARAAQLQLAAGAYNETVINAAREVATQVITLQRIGAQREQALAQLDALQRSLRAAEARQQQGLSDARPALIAQQAVQQQFAALNSLDAAALLTDIQLQQALGGGYAATGAAPAAQP